MGVLIVLTIQIASIVFCCKNSKWRNWIALMLFQLVCVVFSYFGVQKYNFGGLTHFGDWALYVLALCTFSITFLITLFLSIARTPTRQQCQEEAREKEKAENCWPPVVRE